MISIFMLVSQSSILRITKIALRQMLLLSGLKRSKGACVDKFPLKYTILRSVFRFILHNCFFYFTVHSLNKIYKIKTTAYIYILYNKSTTPEESRLSLLIFHMNHSDFRVKTYFLML